MNDPMTDDLIPTNGVYLTETEFPRGFLVCAYDSEGFTAHARWFETKDRAERYATQLRNAA